MNVGVDVTPQVANITIEVDDGFIDWGCGTAVSRQLHDSALVNLATRVCGEMIGEGRFLSLPCNEGDVACQGKMFQVKAIWQDERILRLQLKSNRAFLNDVVLEMSKLF